MDDKDILELSIKMAQESVYTTADMQDTIHNIIKCGGNIETLKNIFNKHGVSGVLEYGRIIRYGVSSVLEYGRIIRLGFALKDIKRDKDEIRTDIGGFK